MLNSLNNVTNGTSGVSLQFSLARLLFTLVLIWSIIWKGIALWKSARNKQKVWFVLILILNTTGILEIVYLIFFQNKSGERVKDTKIARKLKGYWYKFLSLFTFIKLPRKAGKKKSM